MAITTTTISKAAGWARTDVIDQLEQAFTWLGWHGSTHTGLIVGISSYSGGGTVGSVSDDYYEVFPVSTTGIGTGASFYVDRSSGTIYSIFVNRPGVGYTAGEIVTLSAEDIGGSANGATDVEVKVAVAGTVSNSVGYAVSFVSGSNYNADGTDRNGAVSGVNATITIKEGDTLTLANYNSNSGYYVNICWKDEITANNQNRVFNVINQNAGTSGGICTWTPAPGQRGTYFIKDDSSNISGIGTIRIVVTAADPADINYTGIGSTTTFYDKGLPTGATHPWAVLRHEIQPNKKFGSTYRGFQVTSDTELVFHVGSGFNPTNDTTFYNNNQYSYNIYNCSSVYPNRFAGNVYFDVPFTPVSSSNFFTTNSNSMSSYEQTEKTFSVATAHALDLNIFRSSIDPNFAVLSFKHPQLSSLRLRDNTYTTFILHNFTTSIWDLDDLFLSGVTFIEPSTNDNSPFLRFQSFLAGEISNYYSRVPAKRSAEFGYLNHDYTSTYSQLIPYKDTYYRSNSYPYVGGNESIGIYLRNSTVDRGQGGNNYSETLDANTNYNAVIKGIPLNAKLAPCPYYLPDDFVLIDFDYSTPSANIQQGDTITISGSEVYTVIQGSYNQTTTTRGILFCARTV